MIPTWHSSDLVSGTSYGSIYSLNVFWHSSWHILWHSIWHAFWPVLWHSFYLCGILSGILSGIYSDILSDILSDIHEFGSRCPQHPALAISSGPSVLHCMRSERSSSSGPFIPQSRRAGGEGREEADMTTRTRRRSRRKRWRRARRRSCTFIRI